MDWKYVTNNGELSEKPTKSQKDLVGNIVQESGAVIPRACQKCKTKFDSKINQIAIKQDIPTYICNDCKFKTLVSSEALDHKLEFDKHILSKKPESRIAGYKKILVGSLSHIQIKNNDVEILCSDCIE